jgi:hypothetical protein
MYHQTHTQDDPGRDQDRESASEGPSRSRASAGTHGGDCANNVQRLIVYITAVDYMDASVLAHGMVMDPY